MSSLPLNQVLCGNCLEVLSSFPEDSVDLILTDPPYNIAKEGKITQVGGKPVFNKEAWGDEFKDDFTEDDYKRFFLELSKIFDHVLKSNGSILMFFDRGRPYYLEPFYQRFVFRNMIIFIKKNPIPHYRKNNYRSTFEQCAWFSREQYKINFISQRKMINVFEGYIGTKKQTEHPTEKYEWMIHPLIKRHSEVNDIVLDPMCGSGTTLICAKKLQRKFIGIDINPKWVEASKTRILETPRPLTTFNSFNNKKNIFEK